MECQVEKSWTCEVGETTVCGFEADTKRIIRGG
uniref:Uncharacterized protein n=1 Tax=Anguilla anguilla TaxID=7936 RepID=A0A0E9PXG1_ANGAN